jgi:hypothetical protein
MTDEPATDFIDSEANSRTGFILVKTRSDGMVEPVKIIESNLEEGGAAAHNVDGPVWVLGHAPIERRHEE